MSRHFYARYETLNNELRGIIRYSSRKTRDLECSAPMQDGRGWLVAVSEKQAKHDMRALYCLRPYERFFGKLIWVGSWSPVIGSPCETPYIQTH